MAFKNILDTTDYKTLYKNMADDNFELKRINEELKNEIARLKEDYSRSNELLEIKSRSLEYLEKNIKDIESYANKLEFKIDDLNKELKKYNPNLKPPKKKVTKEKVIEVKNMIRSGFNYRVTSTETNISIKTISRIINGYYDDLL